MTLSSYEYVAPLFKAHKAGLWGRYDSSPRSVYFLALEALLAEQDLPCRRVKLRAPYYPNSGHIIKEAVIPAIVLFDDDREILCDLHGNDTPARIVGAFGRVHGLKFELSGNWKTISAWESSSAIVFPSGSPSISRHETLVSQGRAYLQSFALSETPQASQVKSPIRRM